MRSTRWLLALETAAHDRRGQVGLDGNRQERDAPLRRHQRHRHGEIVDAETRRDLNARSLQIAVDRVAQDAGNVGDADEGLAREIARIEGLARRES